MSGYHTKDAYEARLRQRKANRQAPHPFRVFFHVSCMPGWEPIIREMFRYLEHVGLTEVYGCVIGHGDVAKMAEECGVRYYELGRTQDFLQCEGPTLNRVYEYATQHPHGAVIYLHSKGVSAPNDETKAAWRRIMLVHVAGSWRGHLEAMSEYDAIGCAWQPDRDYPHYSGNFWAARCDWLASLQPPWQYRLSKPADFRYAGNSWRNRMYAEHWLGSAQWHHIHSLLGTGSRIWEPGWQRFHLGPARAFDWTGQEPGPVAPLPRSPEAVAVFDHRNIAVGAPGHVYNGSSVRWQDGRLLAVRVGGQITRSSIFLARLDESYQPTGDCRRLRFDHPDCAHSQEDPRLFWNRGELCISFTGTRFDQNTLTSNVLYARLDDRLEVGDIFHPQLPDRRFWEKNHVYFATDEGLMAIYWSQPHTIMRVDRDSAKIVYETPGPKWQAGEIRGGAPPVLHNGHWYHWFHGRRERPGKNVHYQIGCLRFENRPPYRVSAIAPQPILDAGPEHDNSYGADVVFVCGATIEGDDWHIALGFGDRWIEIRKWPVADIEAKMVAV